MFDQLDRYRRAVRDSTRSGGALAAACYRDPALFEVEVEHVLRPAWHAVARWDSLPEPGDYTSIDLLGEPLVIVRDDTARLRVFSRVCRHRAHTIVEGSGNTRTFVCPYHRWSYELNGALRAAPLVKDTPGFDPDDCGLMELPAELWQGFLVTTLAPEPEPFNAALASLDDRLDLYQLDRMHTLDVLDFDSPWNWKVMVENFMESYHHIGPHVATLQKSNPADGTFRRELDGPFSLLENPSRSGEQDFLVGQVFPTLLFFVQQNGTVAGWYEMQIDHCDHIHLRIHILASKDAYQAGVTAEVIAMIDGIHREDIPVCEGVQRGLASRLWQPGPLTRYEACLDHFHRYLQARLERAGNATSRLT